jgi:signal transduction histidine kinase
MLRNVVVGAALCFSSVVAFADAGKDKAVKMVKDAIENTKKSGKEATIALVNKGDAKFKDGETYITIYDLEGKCIAHATKAARVGQNLLSEKDPSGVFFVKERIEIAKTKGSGWQTYKFQNPTNKKIENKEAYAELHDGLIYSAGAYSGK